MTFSTGILYTVLSAVTGILGIFGTNDLGWIIACGGAAILFYVVRQVLLLNDLSTYRNRIRGILESACYVSGLNDPKLDVRVTMYVRSGFNQQVLSPLFGYLPGDARHRLRRIHASKGIVGLCFRTGRIQRWVVQSPANLKEDLIEHWGFSERDAEHRQLDRRSYLALPVLDRDEHPKAVVYFDSSSTDAFSDATTSGLSRVGVLLAGL